MRKFYLSLSISLFVLQGLSVLHGQAPIGDIISQVNINKNGVILYAKDKLNPGGINAVFDDKKLLGWTLVALPFDNTPENLMRLSSELSWKPSGHWTFYYLGNAVATGSGLPTADELYAACVAASIPNSILSLRSFIKSNPNNLDAKVALMWELRGHANRKTAKAMNVDISPKDPIKNPDLLSFPFTIVPEPKTELSPEADLNIWGDLAAMINAAFNSGEWLSILPDQSNPRTAENMALRSPAMKAIYKRYLSRVEAELERRQINLGLWSMWLEFAQGTGRKIRDFIPNFKALPKGGYNIYPWPPVIVQDWMQKEAMASGDWQAVIDLMWPGWPTTLSSLNLYAPDDERSSPFNSEVLAVNREFYWRQSVLPLFEACLRQKDFEKATEIYFALSKRPALAEKAELAARMAKEHKYTFPMANETKDKDKSPREVQNFMSDPIAGNKMLIRPRINSLHDLCFPGSITLLIVESSANGQSDLLREQIKSLISQDRLPEYGLRLADTLSPASTVGMELIDKWSLPNNAFFWGILDEDAKYYHGGNSAPTLDRITNVVESINKKTHLQACREFVRDNPDSVLAKTMLFTELSRLGNIRASNATLGTDGLLNDSEDFDIWGEFIKIGNATIPEWLPRPDDMDVRFFSGSAFKNSRLLQQFALKNITQIENALQDRPHSRELWEFWGTLAPHVPNRSLVSFMNTLTPVPELRDFPPVFLFPGLIRSYQSLDAWASIISLTEPIWKSYESLIESGENVAHRLTRQVWEQYVQPLCDAYEKTGQDMKAEKIRQTWKKAEGWRQAR
jgi:hypothetical protein